MRGRRYPEGDVKRRFAIRGDWAVGLSCRLRQSMRELGPHPNSALTPQPNANHMPRARTPKSTSENPTTLGGTSRTTEHPTRAKAR